MTQKNFLMKQKLQKGKKKFQKFHLNKQSNKAKFFKNEITRKNPKEFFPISIFI